MSAVRRTLPRALYGGPGIEAQRLCHSRCDGIAMGSLTRNRLRESLCSEVLQDLVVNIDTFQRRLSSLSLTDSLGVSSLGLSDTSLSLLRGRVLRRRTRGVGGEVSEREVRACYELEIPVPKLG